MAIPLVCSILAPFDDAYYFISDCLTDIRQNLAAPRLVGKQDGGQPNLQELLGNMHTSMTEQVKSVLANLQASLLYL